MSSLDTELVFRTFADHFRETSPQPSPILYFVLKDPAEEANEVVVLTFTMYGSILAWETVDREELPEGQICTGDIVAQTHNATIVYERKDRITQQVMTPLYNRLTVLAQEDRNYNNDQQLSTILERIITPEAYKVTFETDDNNDLPDCRAPGYVIENIYTQNMQHNPDTEIDQAISWETGMRNLKYISMEPVINKLAEQNTNIAAIRSSLLWQVRLHGPKSLLQYIHNYSGHIAAEAIGMYSHCSEDTEWLLELAKESQDKEVLKQLLILSLEHEDMQHAIDSFVLPKLRDVKEEFSIEDQLDLEVNIRKLQIHQMVRDPNHKRWKNKWSQEEYQVLTEDPVFQWIWRREHDSISYEHEDQPEHYLIYQKYQTDNPRIIRLQRIKERMDMTLTVIQFAIEKQNIEMLESMIEFKDTLYTPEELILVKEAMQCMDNRMNMRFLEFFPQASPPEDSFWLIFKAGMDKDNNPDQALRIFQEYGIESGDEHVATETVRQLGCMLPYKLTRAKTMLKEIIRNYPNTYASNLATQYLHDYGALPTSGVD